MRGVQSGGQGDLTKGTSDAPAAKPGLSDEEYALAYYDGWGWSTAEAPKPRATAAARARAAKDLAQTMGALNPWFSQPRFIKDLVDGAPEVHGLEQQLDRSGLESWGVYAVDTSRGRAALKFSSVHRLDDLKYSLAMQQAAASLDAAPEVLGLYVGRDLDRLVADLGVEDLASDEQKENGRPQVGILMTEIPGAWNFTKREARTPDDVDVSGAKIDAQLRDLADIANALRIRLHDRQFLVSNTGKVYLADFDRHVWHRADDKQFGGQSHGLVTPFVSNDLQFEIRLAKRLLRDGPAAADAPTDPTTRGASWVAVQSQKR